MLVTHVIGDCAGCGGKNCFGNVSVHDGSVLRGCMRCEYNSAVLLPAVRKQIIYLDQFFFSSAFRGRDKRFIDVAERIKECTGLQLLVAPFSSIHEDETHQWRGFDGKNKEDLMEFIKATSGGHRFEPAYEIEHNQIIKAFQSFLAGSSSEFELDNQDAIEGNVHDWDDYVWIDAGVYFKDIELIRSLKRQSAENLVGIFESWRKCTNTFEQNVSLEISASGKGYIDSFGEFVSRIARGDYTALSNSPIMSMVVESMWHCLPNEMPLTERSQVVVQFFACEHFAQSPYQLLSARMFAKLKEMVRHGAFTNRASARERLSGFFHDVKHIATYAPYCDAFLMDQFMSEVIADPRVGLENSYAVKVFSLNNWDELSIWLNALETGMTADHKGGLSAAYPWLK